VRWRAADGLRVVGCGQVKLGVSSAEGFPITALRETNVLMSLRHPNIVRVKEMVVGSTPDKVFMVMEYMEHDLRVYMDNLKEPLSLSEIKCIMVQLLSALSYMHERWVVHRDLKTTNILISNDGRACLCDFGLARCVRRRLPCERV
jgi:cell division cycle 2-like protein